MIEGQNVDKPWSEWSDSEKLNLIVWLRIL